MSLEQRDHPLTESDKRAFLAPLPKGHLAYRLTMLWTYKRCYNKGVDIKFKVCAFEASLIACRVLLEFLGFGIDRSSPPKLIQKREYFKLGGRIDEVKVVDLGGSFASIDIILAEEQEILAKVYYMANRATAHLTHGAPFMEPAELVQKAVPIIDRLLNENLFDVIGQKPNY
nr:putative integron gene cassette protein [uncultured bacterium]